MLYSQRSYDIVNYNFAPTNSNSLRPTVHSFAVPVTGCHNPNNTILLVQSTLYISKSVLSKQNLLTYIAYSGFEFLQWVIL